MLITNKNAFLGFKDILKFIYLEGSLPTEKKIVILALTF